MLIRTDDAQKLFENLKAKHVNILSEPHIFPYGEKQFTIEDMEGNVWTISESVKDVSPGEWGGTTLRTKFS